MGEVRRNSKTLRYESSEIKIFHTFGLALLCFLVLPHLDSVKGLLVTSTFGLGSASKFAQLSVLNLLMLIAHLDDLCIYHCWLFVLIISLSIIPTERKEEQ